MSKDRRISDHCASGQGYEIYICHDDGDYGPKISLISPAATLNFNLGVYGLIHLRSALGDAINEAFEVYEVKCPACGMTKEELLTGDEHKICRNFPFFPGESGESEARAIR